MVIFENKVRLKNYFYFCGGLFGKHLVCRTIAQSVPHFYCYFASENKVNCLCIRLERCRGCLVSCVEPVVKVMEERILEDSDASVDSHLSRSERNEEDVVGKNDDEAADGTPNSRVYVSIQHTRIPRLPMVYD